MGNQTWTSLEDCSPLQPPVVFRFGLGRRRPRATPLALGTAGEKEYHHEATQPGSDGFGTKRFSSERVRWTLVNRVFGAQGMKSKTMVGILHFFYVSFSDIHHARVKDYPTS